MVNIMGSRIEEVEQLTEVIDSVAEAPLKMEERFTAIREISPFFIQRGRIEGIEL